MTNQKNVHYLGHTLLQQHQISVVYHNYLACPSKNQKSNDVFLLISCLPSMLIQFFFFTPFVCLYSLCPVSLAYFGDILVTFELLVYEGVRETKHIVREHKGQLARRYLQDIFPVALTWRQCWENVLWWSAVSILSALANVGKIC